MKKIKKFKVRNEKAQNLLDRFQTLFQLLDRFLKFVVYILILCLLL